MYRFSIRYEYNGRDGQRFVLAETSEEALAKFEHDFEIPASHAWIDGQWSIA